MGCPASVAAAGDGCVANSVGDAQPYSCQISASQSAGCAGIISCPGGPRVRKEVGDLSAGERSRLVSAVLTLHRTPSSNAADAALGRSEYDTYTRIHAENAGQSHGVIAFLIWHREFIYRFETSLRRIDPSVTLPFWDFPLDWARPYDSVVFGADLFGGADYGTINSGVFADLVSRYPNPHFVIRFLTTGRGGSGGSPFVYDTPGTVRDVINDGTLSFEAYASAIENIHATPHLYMGGSALPSTPNFGVTQGDLVFTRTSPSDPLFYMIHGGVDKMLQDRQDAFPSRAAEYDSRGALLGSTLSGLGVTVRSAMFKKCVIYEPTRRAGQTARMATVDAAVGDVGVSMRAGFAEAFERRDSRKIQRDMLLMENADDASDAAEKALALCRFSYLNKMDPIPLIRGLKITQEASQAVSGGGRTRRRRSRLLQLDDVSVNVSAISEVMVEVERKEKIEVANYRAATAEKPYRGFTRA